MSTKTAVNVSDLIDEAPISSLQVLTMVLCGLVAILDGFDTQAIAFVAPVIAREWNTDASAFGPVFGSGLLGLMVGALIFGPVADRFGRRAVIIWSTIIFGAFAMATVTANSVYSLMAMRFLTGIGLGGAMPNIISLTSEYAPQRRRATLVTLMFCGFPLGAVLGGLVSAPLIQRFGWHSVFYLGGLLPLLLAPVLWMLLPESIRYLVSRGAKREQLDRILRKVLRGKPTISEAEFILRDDSASQSALVTRLFKEGRALTTTLLWIVFFSNLLILYFLINWLPVVLQEAGLSIEKAIIGVVALNAGGIVGGLGLGWLADDLGSTRVLWVSYALAAFFVILIGTLSTKPVTVVMITIFLAGMFVIGSQFCMNALAASYYPTTIRSTGVGWALGIGRIGSVIGPVLGGIIISLHWTIPQLFFATAVPALLAAVCVFLIGQLRTSPTTAAQAVAMVH